MSACCNIHADLQVYLQEQNEDASVPPGFIEELFSGELSSRVVCKECNHETVNLEKFYDLSLPIPASLPTISGYPPHAQNTVYHNNHEMLDGLNLLKNKYCSFLCFLHFDLDGPQCISSVSAEVECRCNSVFLWQIAGLVQGASPKGRAPRAKGRQALRGQTRAQQQRNSRNSPPSSARKQRKMYALDTFSKLTSLHSQHSAYTHPCLPKLLLSSYQAAV